VRSKKVFDSSAEPLAKRGCFVLQVGAPSNNGSAANNGGPAESVGVTLYTHCTDGARLLCGRAVGGAGAMLGAPLVATTTEGRQLLVGVLSSDVTTGGVLDTPASLRFADVAAKRAWILAASGTPTTLPSADDGGLIHRTDPARFSCRPRTRLTGLVNSCGSRTIL